MPAPPPLTLLRVRSASAQSLLHACCASAHPGLLPCGARRQVGGYCASEGAASVSMTFTPCAAGTYNPSTGASDNSSCLACPAGTANPIPGSSNVSVCLDCLPGSYTSSTGYGSCTLCAAGTFMNASGATACFDCRPGYYCIEGSAA